MKFPLLVKISITDKCNLRCKHCFFSEYTNHEIKYDELIDILNELKRENVGIVALTGGEPLTHTRFIDIIRYCGQIGLNTAVATNGLLLNDTLMDELENAGIKRIQVSLESYIDETNDRIRGTGSFIQVYRILQKLKERKFNVSVASTLNHLNCDGILGMVKLCDDLGINSLRFELYLPLGQSVDHGLALTKYDINKIQTALKQVEKLQHSVRVKSPFSNYGSSCGAGTQQCIINVDKTMSPCDLLPQLRSRAIEHPGDIRNIWSEDDAFLGWRALECTDRYCSEECLCRNNCAKGCRAAALAYNGKLTEYDPLCDRRSLNE